MPLIQYVHGDPIVMKHYITALILAGGLAAAQAHAACNYPVAPGKFPDGNQASKDEMLAAKGQVVQYNKDMETYLTCIQGEYDTKVAAETQATPEQKADLDALHLRKIDLADRVLVVNPGGYVGESTRREIAYAQAAGKPITFTHP